MQDLGPLIGGVSPAWQKGVSWESTWCIVRLCKALLGLAASRAKESWLPQLGPYPELPRLWGLQGTHPLRTHPHRPLPRFHFLEHLDYPGPGPQLWQCFDLTLGPSFHVPCHLQELESACSSLLHRIPNTCSNPAPAPQLSGSTSQLIPWSHYPLIFFFFLSNFSSTLKSTDYNILSLSGPVTSSVHLNSLSHLFQRILRTKTLQIEASLLTSFPPSHPRDNHLVEFDIYHSHARHSSLFVLFLHWFLQVWILLCLHLSITSFVNVCALMLLSYKCPLILPLSGNIFFFFFF